MKISSASMVGHRVFALMAVIAAGCRARDDARPAPSARAQAAAAPSEPAPVFGIGPPIRVKAGQEFVYLVRANRSCNPRVSAADPGLVKELGRAIESEGFEGGRAFRIRLRAQKPGDTQLTWACDDEHRGTTALAIAP